MKAQAHLGGVAYDLDQIKSIPIDAAASALARNCRFNGNLLDNGPVIWHSVADHCVLVSALLESESGDSRLALGGLLHDAHEALIGDIPTPVKRWFGIGEQEKFLEMQVLASFGLSNLSPTALRSIKTADQFALRIEVNLLGLKPEIFGFTENTQREWLAADRSFCDHCGVLQPLLNKPMAHVFKESRERFLNHYRRLQRAVGGAVLSGVAMV